MRYRILTRQPIALQLDAQDPFSIVPGAPLPLAQLRQPNASAAERRMRGGTFLALEFESPEADLLRAAHAGLELAEDIFSVIALHRGAPLPPSTPVYVESLDAGSDLAFAAFFGMPNTSWHGAVGESDLRLIQSAFQHWGAADDGQRFRRAIRRYRMALGREDHLEAFQDAYMGLEALEKPVAEEMGVPVGHEVVEGQCKNCGARFERKRTVLSGIREYITRPPDQGVENADLSRRRDEWKELSRLRTNLVHGLGEIADLQATAHGLLPAALHYLHDASCHLIHAHHLELNKYTYGHSMLSMVIIAGKTEKPRPVTALSDWSPAVQVGAGRWVERPEGLFPELPITAHGPDVVAALFTLARPLSDATEDDLEPARVELE